jgi:arabinofuranan 3-O-arabinosyltransferase
VCDPDDVDATPQVHLGSGEHRIRTPRTAQFQTVVVAGAAAGSAGVSTARRVDVQTSSGVRRTASIGPGPASVVSMTANANPGWRATLEGRKLDPVRVDGWRQGWLVPAGSGGRLVIDFPAQEWYRAVVIGGLVPAGLTLVAALVLLVRVRRPGRDLPDPLDASARSAAARGGARRRQTGRAAPALAAILLLALGVACILGALVAWAGRRRPWIVMIAGLAVAVSGPLDAGDLAVPVDGVADLLAAAGFGMLFVAAISRPEAEAP